MTFSTQKPQIDAIQSMTGFLSSSPLSFVGSFFLVFYFQENYSRWRSFQCMMHTSEGAVAGTCVLLRAKVSEKSINIGDSTDDGNVEI
jgi:hypothetical protein